MGLAPGGGVDIPPLVGVRRNRKDNSAGWTGVGIVVDRTMGDRAGKIGGEPKSGRGLGPRLSMKS